MSFSCSEHGWQHANKSCEVCRLNAKMAAGLAIWIPAGSDIADCRYYFGTDRTQPPRERKHIKKSFLCRLKIAWNAFKEAK